MESSIRNQVRVGIFLGLGLLVVLGTIMSLGANRNFFSSFASYKAELGQVQGLNVGSLVSLSGIKVGNITAINLNDKGGVVVSFRVESQFKDRISKSSTIDVRTQGALGDKFLFIEAGRAGEAPLDAGSSIPSNTEQDFIGALTEKGGEATKVFAVIEELHRMIVAINKDGKPDRMMRNLTDASESFRLSAKDLEAITHDLKNETPQQIRLALTQLNSILAKVDKGEGTLGALVNDSSLHESLKSFLGSSPRRQSMKGLIRTSIKEGE